MPTPDYQDGLERIDGPLLVGALLRGHPLRGLQHVLKKIENTIWHPVARGVAGSRNGTGGARLVRAMKGLRAPGHTEQETRLAILAKIEQYTSRIDEWLALDPHFEKRREIGRTTLEEVSQMFTDTEWLWPGWLPRGYLSMIAGAPGIGKSTVATWFAAIAMRGGTFPDGHTHDVTGCPGKPQHDASCKCPCVMFIDTEGIQKLVAERFATMNVRLSKIFFPKGTEAQGGDLPTVNLAQPEWRNKVADLALDTQPVAIIVDSLRGAHTGKEGSDTEMQPILAWAAGLARDLNTVFIFVHHLRKLLPGESQNVTIDSVRGSSAIVAMCRTILALDQPEPRNETIRLQVIKSNLERKPEPLGITLTDGEPQPDEHVPQPQRFQTVKERAIAFLEARLLNGPRPSAELYEEAKQVGLSERSIRRAMNEMNLVVIPGTTGKRFQWALPTNQSDQ